MSDAPGIAGELVLDTHNFEPTSIVGIQRIAKLIKRELGCKHTEALDEACQRVGFTNYVHARRIFDLAKIECTPNVGVMRGSIDLPSVSPGMMRWYVVTEDFESIDYVGEFRFQDYDPLVQKRNEFRNVARCLNEYQARAWLQCVARHGAPGAWFVVDTELLVYLGQFSSRAEAELARMEQEQGGFEVLVSHSVARHWRI